jgi:hypothetical protein
MFNLKTKFKIKMKMKVTKQAINAIEQTAKEVIRWPDNRKWDSVDKDERFRALFGAPSVVIAEIWQRLIPMIEEKTNRKHLLWGLLFLKVYSTEEVHCAIVGHPTKKEFRQKSWHIVEMIAGLKESVIILDNRFINSPTLRGRLKASLLTLDCTDCMINEPYPFLPMWVSQKFKGPGVKYEVAIAIYSNNICWCNGPFPASTNESRIFQERLGNELLVDEPIEVDSGPGGDERLMKPDAGSGFKQRKAKSVYRGRQETIFSRLKQFKVLDSHFRHTDSDKEVMLYKHQSCFDAVAVVTQMKLMFGGDKLFNGGEAPDAYFMPRQP